MVGLKKHRNLNVPPVLINNNRFESSYGGTFDSVTKTIGLCFHENFFLIL
jgi:hypothetical protein